MVIIILLILIIWFYSLFQKKEKSLNFEKIRVNFVLLFKRSVHQESKLGVNKTFLYLCSIQLSYGPHKTFLFAWCKR